MSNFNLDRFRKLMNLTKSDNDHEALNALRAANRMLESAGTSWDSMLGSAKPNPPPPPPRERPYNPFDGIFDEDGIEDLFRRYNNGKRDPFR